MKLPRYKLRTLFLFVAVFAVASWAYWIGWPWWMMYQEQCRFEESIKQLHVGNTTEDFHCPQRAGLSGIVFRSLTNNSVCGYFVNWWPDVIYVVVVRFLGDEHGPFKSVELYSLRTVPSDYHPFSAEANKLVSYYRNENLVSANDKARMVYATDFAEFIIGDRKTNSNFKYELIYSDSPAKLEGGTK
jgi:hypothetical protein